MVPNLKKIYTHPYVKKRNTRTGSNSFAQPRNLVQMRPTQRSNLTVRAPSEHRKKLSLISLDQRCVICVIRYLYVRYPTSIRTSCNPSSMFDLFRFADRGSIFGLFLAFVQRWMFNRRRMMTAPDTSPQMKFAVQKVSL